ncbi:hypothetical protein QMK17_12570 [Rhodococcus sp. G-MC3]|uniref:hypothetical protein n=1 Tax=Rhodococcus sp. G-MC3 TaxID=3046209 RepID=UPI0024B95FDB|nr:hypothetical protein [Rhodococcus sp. G-MC3]MDJ0394163.1 hypothetical protein [Rhodococcus sp. G-MC3]
MTTENARIPLLFRGLCDDAALFPPGNVALDVAVPQHIDYVTSAFSDLVGTFVFPATRLSELTPPPSPIRLSLTVPEGPAAVAEALEIAVRIHNVTVVAVEVPVPEGAGIDVLGKIDPSIEVCIEIPRGLRRAEIFDAVDERGYKAKFRTGGVTADACPDENELAQAIHEATRREIEFKATAGLHHAIRNTRSDNGFEQHGYLNVLLAAQAAHSGARVADLVSILANREAGNLAKAVSAIEGSRAFLSFGTCSIREPLDDLIALGLIDPM